VTTKKCGDCRFWSEMCAQSIGGGPIEAVCLSQVSGRTGKFVRATFSCPAWRSNHFGSVDAPPNYGAHARAAYDAEDAS
jgi:hypothetical protein